MNEPESFDSRLAARFEREHHQVPDAGFVASTVRRVRQRRRLRWVVRAGMRAATLTALIAASPWLTAGVKHLNDAIESALPAAGLPSIWVMGALAMAIVLTMRVRKR